MGIPLRRYSSQPLRELRLRTSEQPACRRARDAESV